MRSAGSVADGGNGAKETLLGATLAEGGRGGDGSGRGNGDEDAEDGGTGQGARAEGGGGGGSGRICIRGTVVHVGAKVSPMTTNATAFNQISL